MPQGVLELPQKLWAGRAAAQRLALKRDRPLQLAARLLAAARLLKQLA